MVGRRLRRPLDASSLVSAIEAAFFKIDLLSAVTDIFDSLLVSALGVEIPGTGRGIPVKTVKGKLELKLKRDPGGSRLGRKGVERLLDDEIQ
jgi:hypothetical protein